MDVNDRPAYYEEWSAEDFENGIQAMVNLQADRGFRLLLQDVLMNLASAERAIVACNDPNEIFRLQGEIRATMKMVATATDIQEHLELMLQEKRLDESARKHRNRRPMVIDKEAFMRA